MGRGSLNQDPGNSKTLFKFLKNSIGEMYQVKTIFLGHELKRLQFGVVLVGF